MIGIQVEVVGGQALQAAYVKLEDEISDLGPIFEAVGPEVLDDIQRRIDNHPGPPLSASTVRRKGHTRILRDTDGLYGSFEKDADRNVFRIKPLEAEFGTSDEKAVYHQTGTSRMPKRTIIEVTGEQEAKYARIAGDKLRERIRAIGFEVS